MTSLQYRTTGRIRGLIRRLGLPRRWLITYMLLIVLPSSIIFYAYYKHSITVLEEEVSNSMLQTMKQAGIKGPQGKFGLSEPTGFDRITYIPKASKYPDDAIKWINAKLDKDTFRNMTIGEENKHYTFKDGAYTPILPIFNDERNQAVNFLTGSDEKNYPTYWQARVRKDARLFAAWEYLNVKEPTTIRVKDPLGLSPYLPEYSKNNSSLSTMVNDQTVKFISGGEPLTGLDAFITKFKASGGDASVKEVNDWYATVKK